MGKGIKFFKKLTSLVLAGLTIFSAVPVKAWKAEDPRHAVQAEIDKLLAEGYKKITAQDVNEQLEYAMNASWWDDYDEKLDVGKIIADFCSRKHIDYAKVISIDFIPFFCKGYTNNNFYVESLSRFKNLINFNMNCENMQLSAYAFMNNTNLKWVDFSGSYRSKNRERYIRDGGWYRGTYASKLKFATLGGNHENTYGEEIDLFSSCIYPVTLICSSDYEANFFKKFMGTQGKRHKILLAEDLEKFDEVNREPFELELDKSIEAITLESTNQVRVEIAHFNESKNIVIPKHVKKVEQGAFKNAGLCGVTFEEGMEEIEFCDECFAGCPLVKFELPKSLKKITLGKDCFKGCSNKVAIENYIRAEQTRIENEEIKKREEEERKRQEEAERKRKEEEERKRKEEEEKMKRKKEELETWKKENKQKIEKEKAKLQKEINGNKNSDSNSLMYKRIEAQGVKKHCENELKSFLKNHPEYITKKDIKLFEFNNQLIEKAKTKFSSNKSSEIDNIRAELISKENKLLRSKLKVAKLKFKLYDKEIKNKEELIGSLDDRLKDLEKITEIQKDYDTITKLMVENKVLKNDLKLRIEEAEKQKEEYEKLKNELSEKEKLQKEIGIGHEKTAKELNDQREEQERITKQQDEEKGNLERKEQKLKEGQNKLEEEQQKLKKEKIIWNSVKFLGKAVLTLSPFAPFIPVVGPIITSVVQPIITSSVSAVTSIVGLVANLTVDICKSLFTSKSKKEVHQKPSNSTPNTLATPV